MQNEIISLVLSGIGLLILERLYSLGNGVSTLSAQMDIVLSHLGLNKGE